MNAVHVYATYVRGLHEGITRNIDGLCRALQAGSHDVRLDASEVDLGDLNRRRTHLTHGWRARQFLKRAFQDRSVDLVHYHVSFPAMGLFARGGWLRGRKRTPLVVHAWNAFYRKADMPEGVTAQERLLHAAFNGRRMARLGLGHPDALVVSSRFQEDQWRSAGYDGAIHVVPNGVDLEAFRPAEFLERHLARARFGVDGDPVLLYYGHLSPWKGVSVLLDALPRILRDRPNTRVLLAHTDYGRGGAWLQTELARRGLAPYVRVQGVSDVRTLLATADMVVLPYLTGVGTACFPNVLLESLAAGVPVVSTKVGSIPEVVRDAFGRLAEPGDANDLAEQVLRIAADPVERAAMGRAARRYAVESHDWARIAGRMHAVYEQLVPGLAKPTPAPAATPPRPTIAATNVGAALVAPEP